jgi:hypothetical protein
MNRKRLLPEQFFKYITAVVNKEDVDTWVRMNNVNTQKLELFFDFINGLYTTIRETYLGDDVIVGDKERKEHFNWCWNNLLNNFGKESIYFNQVGSHYEYFWNFFYESYYVNKKEENTEKICDFLNRLFRIHIEKTNSELDMLKEIYFILEQNLTVDK